MTRSQRLCGLPSMFCLTILILSTVSLTAAAAAKGTACDPRALGAKADGQTKDTAALQGAIDQCAKGAGGIVELTAGTYVSAPLTLRSHVHLVLDKGATLLGSPDMEDYPIRTDAPWRRVLHIRRS